MGTQTSDVDNGDRIPPEPWFLGGDLRFSAWLVPLEDLPPQVREVPRGWRPVRLGRYAVVGAAVAHYAPGGVLAYEELLVALPVRRGARLRITIPRIWVTTTPARDGGRRLWSIPKELAVITREAAPSGSMRVDIERDGERLASLTSRPVGPRLPGTWTLPLPTIQVLDGVRVAATNRVTSRLRVLRTRWRFAGPLAILDARRPVVSLMLDEAAVTFGRNVARHVIPDASPDATQEDA